MPKAPTQPQFGEHGGIDRRREGNREERQNAILAGKIERPAAAPHRGDQGSGAEHEAGLGEGQGPARRMMLSECQKSCSKRSMAPTPKPLVIDSEEMAYANNAQSYITELQLRRGEARNCRRTGIG